MIDFSNLNPISLDDSRRLEKTFFSPREKKPKRKKKIIVIGGIVFLCIAVLTTFFVLNFNVLILPQYKNPLKDSEISLLKNELVSSITLINPQLGSKITKNTILIDVPFNADSGFAINLKDKIDISNSTITLVVKNVRKKFNIRLILRDNNFFSNAKSPLEKVVTSPEEDSAYIEIPITIKNIVDGTLNTKRITQLRFIFYQDEINSLPVLIKEIILRKRR